MRRSRLEGGHEPRDVVGPERHVRVEREVVRAAAAGDQRVVRGGEPAVHVEQDRARSGAVSASSRVTRGVGGRVVGDEHLDGPVRLRAHRTQAPSMCSAEFHVTMPTVTRGMGAHDPLSTRAIDEGRCPSAYSLRPAGVLRIESPVEATEPEAAPMSGDARGRTTPRRAPSTGTRRCRPARRRPWSRACRRRGRPSSRPGSKIGAGPAEAACRRAANFLAMPGATRSSVSAVVISVAGYATPSFTLCSGEYFEQERELRRVVGRPVLRDPVTCPP